jgi:ATP-dependent RNA helicase DeaD
MLFSDLPLNALLQQAIEKMGFTQPSPIQEQAIPILLEGKDIIGQAQTGTGKTAAFGLPILEKIDLDNRNIQAMVICPTRELAVQVTEEFRKLASQMKGLSIVSVYGGQPMDRQMLALKKRPQIIVGTPGRLLDLLWRGTFHLNGLKVAVLDEADEMLNMGFREDIEKIFDFMPAERQTVFFSATMPRPILELTKLYQRDPQLIKVAPKAAEVSQITQSYLEVSPRNKSKALVAAIQHHELNLAIIFCNTKHQVDSISVHLQNEGFSAEGLHGGKPQNKRERILNAFRRGNIKFLVATDVAARGIDVSNIDAVINYDLPEDIENYTHRIGRTGRAGKSGLALSFVTGQQTRTLLALQKSQNNAISKLVLEGIPLPDPVSQQNEGFGGRRRSNFGPPRAASGGRPFGDSRRGPGPGGRDSAGRRPDSSAAGRAPRPKPKAPQSV